MGVFDKIKNLFYEDEVIEVPKENNEEIKKEEIIEEKKDEMDDVVSERDLLKSETTFKFPVIFEDEDFADMEKEKQKPKVNISNNESRENKNTTKYKKPTLDREVIREVMEKPKKFTPSPVISPVYGVLDKDYSKKSNNKNGSDKLEQTKEMIINFDTIRQKAYGSLTDDIENVLSPSTSEIDEIEDEINSILEENNLLSDLEDTSDDTIPEAEKIEEENTDEYNYADFGVEYKIDETKKKEKKEPKEDKKIEESEEKKIEKEKPTQEDDVKKDEKEVELTEDLFNLIDSMYDR